jgi:hypothetical protein
MPIPRHSAALAFAQLPLAAQCDGVTELRVHGVGGTPPDALLGDLAPEQASGDGIAGFYRSDDAEARADGESQNWERDIARAQFLGQATHDASWLLWCVIAVRQRRAGRPRRPQPGRDAGDRGARPARMPSRG